MAIINCKDVSLGYDKSVVISDVNFKLNGGEYMCIVGENGAGKSTLIKALLNLKKPLKGNIIYGDGLRKNEIGYLPQQTLAQRDFPASVYEVVLSGRLNSLGYRPFFTTDDKKEALKNMSLMGITDYKNRCYQELSGGQQQRVLLARALCATKKLLLLDEPVAGLDPVVTKELYELIARINKELNITIIMVSHDIDAAIKYSTHMLHIASKMLFFGKTDAYVKSDAGKRFINTNVDKKGKRGGKRYD